MSLKKKLAAAGVAIAVAGGTGLAWAYWSANGSGSGSASTKNAISVTLTGNAVSNLVPGAPATNITGTVTVSDGATSAYVGTITPSIDTAHTTFNSGCSVDDFAFTSAAHDAQISAGATNVAFGTIQLKDTSSDQNGCKSQTLALSFSSN